MIRWLAVITIIAYSLSLAPQFVHASDTEGRAQAYLALQASVILAAKNKDDLLEPFCGGVLVAPLLVLTAYHCVLGKTSFLVVDYSGQTIPHAGVIRKREGWDLALIQLQIVPPALRRSAALGDSVGVGETAYLTGAPDNDAFAITKGIVSRVLLDRFINRPTQGNIGSDLQSILQLDIRAFYGNSGAGVFSIEGRLLGILVRVGVMGSGVSDAFIPYPDTTPTGYTGSFILFAYAVGLDTLRSFLENSP